MILLTLSACGMGADLFETFMSPDERAETALDTGEGRLFDARDDDALALAEDLAWEAVGDAELELRRASIDHGGGGHVRFVQLHEGLLVRDAGMVVHLDPTGAVDQIDDYRAEELLVFVTPTVSEDRAVELASEVFGGPRLVTQEPWVRLIVVRGEDADHLAWAIVLQQVEDSSIRARRLLVDAETGEVLEDAEAAVHTSTPASADTNYNGTVGIETWAQGSYVLEDQGRNLGGYRLVNGSWSYVTNGSTTWTAWPDHTEAHWGLAETWDFLWQEHGLDGPDGLGGPVNASSVTGSGWLFSHLAGVTFVIVTPGGTVSTPNNAAWISTGLCDYGYVAFGAGDGTTWGPVTALDVSAHELGHALMECTADVGDGPASGAINEGWSDALAVAVEARTYGAADWTIGEDVVTGGILRDVCDPTATGGVDHMLDWDPSVGVHDGAGVPNRAFCLVAQDLGLEAASDTWFDALAWMKPGDGFPQAAHATSKAAASRWGFMSPEHCVVRDAWNAVGVSAGCTPLDPTVVGPVKQGPVTPAH